MLAQSPRASRTEHRVVLLRRKLVWSSVWTIGGFGFGQVLRLITNIILTRFLAPEIFGIMTIVNSLRTGFELLSDFGISQNIVHSKAGAEPDFYNTAWTMQLIRGSLLWVVSIIAAPLVASFYGMPLLGVVLPVVGLVFVILGLGSTSIFVMQKQMLVGKRIAFDAAVEFFSAFVHIVATLLYPTIWALVFGGVIAAAAKSIGSHFVASGLRNRLHISRKHLGEILGFGRWIFVASGVYFFATYFDRLYFGTVFPLGLLGVYGIARSLADAASLLASRLTGLIVFPYISGARDEARLELRLKVYRMRLAMILIAAIGVAIVASFSDFIVEIMFDSRYWDAKWMLPLLCIGSWFAILNSLNEAILLGFGRPAFPALANIVKFAFLAVGLPLGFHFYGAVGAISIVILSELARYFPIYLGVYREQFSFGTQDILATLIMLLVIALFLTVRSAAGTSALNVGMFGFP